MRFDELLMLGSPRDLKMQCCFRCVQKCKSCCATCQLNKIAKEVKFGATLKSLQTWRTGELSVNEHFLEQLRPKNNKQCKEIKSKNQKEREESNKKSNRGESRRV